MSSAILITGAGKRIGRALALDLAAHGHDIAVHYNSSPEAAQEVASLIKRQGHRAALVGGDLADPTVPERVIAEATRQLGPLSALINNASIYEKDAVGAISADVWQRHQDINLRAPVLLAQAFAKSLPPGATGNVINLIDGRVWNLKPTYFSYTVSKSALWSATQMLAQALAPRIRVNAIGPGPTLAPPGVTAAEQAADERATLLQRGTSPQDIADAVRFILSQEALTGQMIALDAGQHLVWQHREPIAK